MPYRLLSDEEVRQAALENMTHGDWTVMRDVVVKLFPSAITFAYQFVSEYNDQGYDIQMRLVQVMDIHGYLVTNGSLTDHGTTEIQKTPGWYDYIEGSRYGTDPEDYFNNQIWSMDDVDAPKMWLEEGDDSDVIYANVKSGPERKYPMLFVSVSE